MRACQESIVHKETVEVRRCVHSHHLGLCPCQACVLYSCLLPTNPGRETPECTASSKGCALVMKTNGINQNWVADTLTRQYQKSSCRRKTIRTFEQEMVRAKNGYGSCLRVCCAATAVVVSDGGIIVVSSCSLFHLFREVSGCRGAWVSYSCAKAGGNGKNPRITSFPWRMSVVGTSVVADSLRESVRVWAGLEQACCLFLRAKAHFLGGFVEDVDNRIMPSVAIPGTGSDGGVIAKAIEDLAAQGHCVCCKAARVKSASQSQSGELELRCLQRCALPGEQYAFVVT